MVKMKKKVGIFVPTFLNTSETFIYNIVSKLKIFKPVIFAKEQKNQKLFPIDQVHTIKDFKFSERFSDNWLKKYGATIGKLKKEGVLLIHAQFGTVGAELVALKEQWPALPLITHFRGQDAYQLVSDPFYRMKLKKLFRLGDLFLTVSENMRDYLVENLGCPEKKVEVHYGGIDLHKMKYKVRNLRGGRKKLKLLMCGRLTEKKGFEYGIRAFFELLARGYDLYMEIIGQGPLENNLKKFVKKLRIEKHIKFLGDKPQDFVLKTINSADLLLAPYVIAKNGDREGIPNILKEALACGLPVISTKHAGVPEIIKDEVTGFLVNEKAVIMLSRKIEELCKDEELVKKFAHKGRELVEKQFNLEKQNAKLERYYQKVLS
ncbi:glycosyltransferase [Candidatus Margulisiibacteriota bacterium]